MKKMRLWIADDHVVVRNGLQQIAAATQDLTVIGESQDGPGTLQAMHRKDIDVLILDISMPGGGLDLIPCLLQEQPLLPILILSMHDEPQLASRAARAGASGYVTKDASIDVLLKAVRTVAGGGHFMEPRLANTLLFEKVRAEEPSLWVLTKREREILKRLVSAENPAGIAASLGCSTKTVSVHKSRLMRKLGVKTNVDLLHYAIRHSLLQM